MCLLALLRKPLVIVQYRDRFRHGHKFESTWWMGSVTPDNHKAEDDCSVLTSTVRILSSVPLALLGLHPWVKGSNRSGVEHGADVGGGACVQSNPVLQNQRDERKVESCNSCFLSLGDKTGGIHARERGRESKREREGARRREGGRRNERTPTGSAYLGSQSCLARTFLKILMVFFLTGPAS